MLKTIGNLLRALGLYQAALPYYERWKIPRGATVLVHIGKCGGGTLKRGLAHANLGLPYEDHVRAVHERACLGSDRPHDAYRTHEVNRNSIAMATAWHGELAARDLAVIRDIWERFDVPLYRDDADWRVP